MPKKQPTNNDRPYKQNPALHLKGTSTSIRITWLMIISISLIGFAVAGQVSARVDTPRLTAMHPVSDGPTPTPPRTVYLPRTLYLPLIMLQKPPEPLLYRLTVAPEDLAWLYDPNNLWTHETVPATFTYESTSYDVQVRFRGGTVRYLPKKSWKIDFPAATPFQGQRELNLNAEYTDKSLMREILAYDLFKLANLPAPTTQFARLELNGQYMGLFLQVEQIDKRFLHRIGWDPNANLYKATYGGNFGWRGEDAAESYVKKTNEEDSHDDIMALLWLLHITSDADFPAAITSVMDIGRYLDWYTVQIVIGNYEWLEKNYYLYYPRPPSIPLAGGAGWRFLPWDLDLTLGHNWGINGILDHDITWDNPIDSGTKDSPKADGVWNQLITRILNVEEFRFAYCRRLQAMLNDEFTEATLFPRIDTYYHYITPYAETDPHKWGSNEEFHAGPDELKTYIIQRRAWLNAQAAIYCPTEGPMPLINELMPLNDTGPTDEAGDHDPWLELYNPGLVSFDVSGMILHNTQTGTLALQWPIPEDTVIPPQDFLLIWADGEPNEGPLHTNFRLTSSDQQTHTLRLLDRALYDHTRVDQKAYQLENTGQYLLGRIHDGASTWTTFTTPTPGWSNLGYAPTITQTHRMPHEPRAEQAVTVSTIVYANTRGQNDNSSDYTRDLTLSIQDDTRTPSFTLAISRPLTLLKPLDLIPSPLSVTLHWHTNGKAYSMPMHTNTSHNLYAGGYYSARLPALSAGTHVRYAIQAQNSQGLMRYDPPSASTYAANINYPVDTHHSYEYIVGFTRPPLYINELTAINQDTLNDESGESADWFEIYNAGPQTINLSGMYLTDAIENTTKWQIPQGISVPGEGRVIFWADNELEEGPTHVNFKLDGDGERLALYASEAHYNGLIDEVYYGPQRVDQPFGRYPDGAKTWRILSPTPGQANRQPAPRIATLDQTPRFPMAGQTITIRALIQDEGHILTATLYYTNAVITDKRNHSTLSAQEYKAVPMHYTSNSIYQAQIPSQSQGALVHYYVQAWDDLYGTTRFPTDAPDVVYGYDVGISPPPVVINEFLASNDSINQDERGEYEDWVELYHADVPSPTSPMSHRSQHRPLGNLALDLGGLYLTDDLSTPDKWCIPENTTISPGGFLIIWTDDDEGDTSNSGPLHTNFKLNKDGEEIGLFQQIGIPSGNLSNVYMRIDHFIFQRQATDISMGRSPDGHDTWRTFDIPTPGQSNISP